MTEIQDAQIQDFPGLSRPERFTRASEITKPSGRIRISSAPSATHVRPTAPVLPGISGWTRTMLSGIAGSA